MNKKYETRKVKVFDYAKEILQALEKGILLTSQSGDKVNSMAISYGTLGSEWGKDIFTVFVRKHRFTYGLLEKNPEFTINIPLKEFDKNVIGVCGSKSGRSIDKIAELGLTLVNSEIISVPGIKEFPLTLECRVVYRQLQDKNAIPEDIRQKEYPQDVDGSHPFANKDFHEMFYGEIVNAYIITESVR